MSPEIARILERGESEISEFKGPQASLDALARDVCAMLNQQGGVILWGVTDDRRVVGLMDAETRATQLNDYIVQHVRPRPLISISVETSGRHQLVEVDVPPGADKPYSITREIWIRIATSTLRATSARSAELVERSAAQLERWEREVMPGFSVPACDSEELSLTRTEIAQRGRFGIAVPETDEELLKHLNMSRSGHLTNGCVVLFARKPRQWAPNLSLRITSYSQPQRGPISSDTVLEGPAVSIVQEAVAVIQQRTGFAGTFDRHALARQDRPAYPLYALREGLVNAMVHRDYGELGDVRVEIYPDSLMIHNPGQLPIGWTTKDLRKDHVSKPTNPDIARVFYLRGLMEQLGMGTQRLMAECRAMGAKAPLWIVNKGTVSLKLFRAEIVTSLSPRQARFVERSKRGRTFALRDYARAAKVSERQARRDLHELEHIGIVDRQGKGPATSYRLRPNVGDFDADAAQEAAIMGYRKSAPTSERAAIKSVDAMVKWFFERYEDPANGVPHDSGEGGYQYVAGGPYNAEEELRKAFDDGSTKIVRMITEAARRIEGDGTEWIKRGEY